MILVFCISTVYKNDDGFHIFINLTYKWLIRRAIEVLKSMDTCFISNNNIFFEKLFENKQKIDLLIS